MSDAASLRRQVEALGPWFHNLHLPGGVQTLPDSFIGGDFPGFKWRAIAPHLPQDLHGWRVLDVCCNAGFYSFELARRGAEVTAIDVEELYLRQARWAAGVLGLQERIRFERMGVYEVGRLPGRFDLVWFMGVFYHLRHPLLALDLLARRTARLLMFQTLTMPGNEVHPDTGDRPLHDRAAFRAPGWPTMAFVEHSFAGDPSNWWVPNHAACEALLRASGLRVLARPADEMYLCAPALVAGRTADGDSTQLAHACAAAAGLERGA